MSTPLTDEQLAAIRERADKATPGPWTSEHESWAGPNAVLSTTFNGHAVAVCGEEAQPYPASVDAAFIAAARQDVPALLTEIERLKAERGRAIDALSTPGRDAVASTGDLEDGINMDSACRNYEQDGDDQRKEINRLKDGLVALIRAWRAHDDESGDYGRCADEIEGVLNGGAWC